MAIMNFLLMSVYIALVLYSAWSDARKLRIPNWISLALMAGFVGSAFSVGLSFDVLLWHLAAGATTLVFGFGLFAFGYFGGGDAKLMAVSALWIGWDHLVFFVFAVLLVGGVLSLLVVVLRKGLGLWPDWLVKNAEGLFTPNKAVPYGIAIAAGVLLTLPRMDMLPPAWQVHVNWFVL
ncbi:MAG: hypothetical protein COB59_05150 [Rhodospirillaceae bacterium]|nr:MAG: hypothetical protein COB59_05150 [Rhodospirillaceae bacterium]